MAKPKHGPAGSWVAVLCGHCGKKRFIHRSLVAKSKLCKSCYMKQWHQTKRSKEIEE